MRGIRLGLIPTSTLVLRRWASGLSSGPARRVALFEEIAHRRRVESNSQGPVVVTVVDPASGAAVEVETQCGTPRDAFKRASIRESVVAAHVGGALWDVGRRLAHGATVSPLRADDNLPQLAAAVAHSAAHVLGAALEEVFPGIMLTNGPGNTDGTFYYEGCWERCSAEVPHTIGATELATLEKVVRRLMKANHAFERIEATEEEAREVFADSPFKQRYISQALARGHPTAQCGSSDATSAAVLSLYRCGNFVDLCRGPHVASTGVIGDVALLSANASVWDPTALREIGWPEGETPEMQRVHGVAFAARGGVAQWRKHQKELAERSHRAVGTAQDLFMLHPMSPGAPFFLPHGTRIINRLKEYLQRRCAEQGYDEVMTPTVFSKELWQRSGHWDHYADDMFFVSDDGPNPQKPLERGLKPMNCPGHCLLFAHRTRSYRELPVRVADFSSLHRNESSGALSGLTRVREFHQDDGHVFCAPEHVANEVGLILDLIRRTYSLNLSTRPEKYMGDAATWDVAEARLREALDGTGERWSVDEGGGAFYGPKIDVTLRDVLGRHHQTATIQLDFQLPQRFDLWYTTEGGEQKRPVIIHRAVLGSLERFFAILCEHTGGNWPLWMSPRQVVVCSVSAAHAPRAQEIHAQLRAAGVHADLEAGDESLGRRLRRVRPLRHNYTIVVGDTEVASGLVVCKERGADDTGPPMTVDELIAVVKSAEADVLGAHHVR